MFFVIDENHNLVEAYDKEGVLAVLEKAIADGSLSDLVADASFVSKLKCCVSGQTNRVAFVTQAKYNELEAMGGLIANCYYFITDSSEVEDIDKALADINEALTALGNRLRALEQRREVLLSSAVYPTTGGTVSVPTLKTTDKIEVAYAMDADLEQVRYVTVRANRFYLTDFDNGTMVYAYVYMDGTDGVLNIGNITASEFKIISITKINE